MVYQAYQKSLKLEMDFLTICDSVLGIYKSEIVQEREMGIEKGEERKEENKREKVKKVESIIEPQIMAEVLEEEREEKRELPIKRVYCYFFCWNM